MWASFGSSQVTGDWCEAAMCHTHSHHSTTTSQAQGPGMQPFNGYHKLRQVSTHLKGINNREMCKIKSAVRNVYSEFWSPSLMTQHIQHSHVCRPDILAMKKSWWHPSSPLHSVDTADSRDNDMYLRSLRLITSWHCTTGRQPGVGVDSYQQLQYLKWTLSEWKSGFKKFLIEQLHRISTVRYIYFLLKWIKLSSNSLFMREHSLFW